MVELADESVHCIATSPPYWGLRKYKGSQELIWGGDKECEHEWAAEMVKRGHHSGETNPGKEYYTKDAEQWSNSRGCYCQKCGAWKGAFGLEPTPEMYVQHTVEILREIRRVLREDGVVFWNIGDSYATGKGTCFNPGGGKGSFSGHGDRKDAGVYPLDRGNISMLKAKGLKPKDLCLIPFRIAIALQKPYYTGKIKEEKDRIWLASMIDGEGCLFIHKRKIGQDNGSGYKRKSDTYGAGLEVANTHKSIVDKCQRITGVGSICCVERETKHKARNLPLYRWNVRSNECRWIIREVYPHLVGKQHEARLLLGCPSSGSDADKAHVSLMDLHNGKEACIDFPPPETMYEPGWYVRSVIIWSKNNPMPESVKDRPTNAYEFILMLTKSRKYYWDIDAVREDYSPTVRWGGDKYNGATKDYPNNEDAGLARERSCYPNTGRNLRDVWTFPTRPCPEAHFAVFPEKLPETCIKAATSEKGCCPKCGAPWARVLDKKPSQFNIRVRDAKVGRATPEEGYKPTEEEIDQYPGNPPDMRERRTIGWRPTCHCEQSEAIPCTVLDPFCGTGTTLWVAKKLGRRATGYDISEAYCQLAVERNRQMAMELTK